MTTLKRRKRGFPYRLVWFASTPRLTWIPTVFYQCPGAERRLGLVRKPFHTFLSALSGEPDSWLAVMSSTTRNEIKQAAKGGVVGETVSLEVFLEFYNAFAVEKGIQGTTRDKLASFGASLVLTAVRVGERPLAMHALMLDAEAGRSRLLLSASARFLDSADRTQVGKANRWLHWWDMAAVSERGISVYDWGGYAKDSEDPAKQGINRFKEAFGGTPVEESHYYPFYLSWMQD